MSNAIDIDHLERVGQRATEGPWKWDDGDQRQTLEGHGGEVVLAWDGTEDRSQPNSESFPMVRDKLFIQTARNNWQALIDECRKVADIDTENIQLRALRARLEVENERLLAEIERLKNKKCVHDLVKEFSQSVGELPG